MVPNPYIKAVTGSNGPKPKKEKGQKSVQFDGAAASPKGKEKDTSQQELLKHEILALGGDEEDLKLLRDVESDSEVEGDAEEPKKKGKDKVDVSPAAAGKAFHLLQKAHITLPLAARSFQGPSLAVQISRLCVRRRSCSRRFGRGGRGYHRGRR